MSTKKTKTAPLTTQPPTPPPDPVREAEGVLDSLKMLDWDYRHDLRRAQETVDLAEAQRDHVAGKAKRILSGNCRTSEDLRDMLAETFVDSLLRPLFAKALKAHELCATGATDQQIADELWRVYKDTYSNKWPKFVTADFGSSYGRKAGVIKDLTISVAATHDYGGPKPMAQFKGAQVIAEARRLLKIPQPAKVTTSPPAAKKKPASTAPLAAAAPSKGAKKTPARLSASKSAKKPAPAATKQSKKTAEVKALSASASKQKQTYLQWLAGLRGILERIGQKAILESTHAEDVRALYDQGLSATGAATTLQSQKAKAPKPASKNVPGDRPKQAFDQWLATVRSTCNAKGTAVPFDHATEKVLREKFDAGVSASTAAMIYRGEKLQPVNTTSLMKKNPTAVDDKPAIPLGQMQTFNQWLAGVKASLKGQGLAYDAATDEAEAKDHYQRGSTPRHAGRELAAGKRIGAKPIDETSGPAQSGPSAKPLRNGEHPTRIKRPTCDNVPLPVVQYIESITNEELRLFATDCWVAHVNPGDRDWLNEAHGALRFMDRVAVEDKLEALAQKAGIPWDPPLLAVTERSAGVGANGHGRISA